MHLKMKTCFKFLPLFFCFFFILAAPSCSSCRGSKEVAKKPWERGEEPNKNKDGNKNEDENKDKDNTPPPPLNLKIGIGIVQMSHDKVTITFENKDTQEAYVGVMNVLNSLKDAAAALEQGNNDRSYEICKSDNKSIRAAVYSSGAYLYYIAFSVDGELVPIRSNDGIYYGGHSFFSRQYDKKITGNLVSGRFYVASAASLTLATSVAPGSNAERPVFGDTEFFT